VWSIAVILFEALTGKTPFAGESATGMAAAIVVDQPFQLRDLRPEVPEALEQIVMAALSKSPAQRTPTVAAFAEQLARFAPSHAQVGAPAAVPAPAPSSSGAASPPPNLITVSAPSAVDGGAPPLITASVPPGPTQASWAQPAVASSQPLPMRTIVALFVVLLLGITAALSAGLFFLRRSAPAPASASIDPPALSAHLASARPAASAVVTATGPSVVEPTPASSAPPPGSAAPSAKPSAGPPVAAAPPSARPPSLLSSAAPPASLPKPATKDCAASEKILVGSKLVCP
jgi:serine/threonine-protein kinase